MKRFGMIVLWSSGLVIGAVCLGDDLQNRLLLETLPRNRRESLATNLAEFDRLGREEQGSIRRLDETIAATEPVEQARFRSLLHHYHLWFQGLTDEQRTQLLATTDLNERFQLARKFRLAENAGSKREGPRIARIRTGEFGLVGPFTAAQWLKVWHDLTPERRAEIAKNPPGKIREELTLAAKRMKIRLDRFSPDQEKVFTEQLETDPEFQPVIELMLRKVERSFQQGDASKKADLTQNKFEHPLAEFRYFEEHRPKPVDPARLERFASWCPDWFHLMTDSLSADDARDFYTILYRLIPTVAETVELAKPAKTPATPAAKTAPRSKPDSGSTPF